MSIEKTIAQATNQGVAPAIIAALRRGYEHAAAIIDVYRNVPVDLAYKDLYARTNHLRDTARTDSLTGKSRSIDLGFANGFSQRVDEWFQQQDEAAVWPTEADRIAAMNADTARFNARF